MIDLKKLLVLTAAIPLLLLCGCNGYCEIDRGYLATAIGISQNANKTCIYIEAVSSQALGDKSSQSVVLSQEGSDFASAYKGLTENLIKPVYFKQLGTVVFDIAVSDKFIESSLDGLDGLDGTNLGIYLVKTNSVSSLFEAKQEGAILGYDIIGLIKNYEKENDTALSNQLYQYNRGGSALPLINTDGEKLILNVG